MRRENVVKGAFTAGRPSPGVSPDAGRRVPETAMAKGQKKSNKEVRKPKADKKPAAAPTSRFIEVAGKK